MTWVTHDKADQAIIEEIEAQSDRGAALVAAAYLESRLLQTIKLRLDRDMSPELSGRLFGSAYAPLGSFSSKIDLGYALQLYPDPVYRLLRQVRRIRNSFAHEMNPLSFESQAINDLCNRNIIPLLPACPAEGWKHIRHLEKQLGYPERHHFYGLYAISEDIITGRQIYMAAIKALLLLLSRAMDVFAQHRIVLSPSPDRSAQQPPQPTRRLSRGRKKRERPPESSPA